MKYKFFLKKLDVRRDVEHARVKIYDVVPNVLTSKTCNNLMNKENKVQKIKKHNEFVNPVQCNSLTSGGYQSSNESTMIVPIQS
jgi:hypothetical protein